MHCKFIIIDDKYLIEGSMNLGEKSLKNYEHVTVCTDKDVLSQFEERFYQMWGNSQRFSDYTNDDEDENGNTHSDRNAPKKIFDADLIRPIPAPVSITLD